MPWLTDMQFESSYAVGACRKSDRLACMHLMRAVYVHLPAPDGGVLRVCRRAAQVPVVVVACGDKCAEECCAAPCTGAKLGPWIA